jgi:hypothetical protein
VASGWVASCVQTARNTPFLSFFKAGLDLHKGTGAHIVLQVCVYAFQVRSPFVLVSSGFACCLMASMMLCERIRKYFVVGRRLTFWSD